MPFKVGVLGAGAVGAYVGGLIALRTKSDVVMVGRRRFVDQVSAGGVTLRPDPRRPRDVHSIRAMHVTVDDDPKALAGCDIVLVAVKSTATADAAAQLERIAERGGFPPHALVLSLQNGVGNGSILVRALEKHGVATLPCMVNFNVVWDSYASDDVRDGCKIRRCTPAKPGMPCIGIHNLPERAVADGTGLVDHPSVFAAKKANLAAFVESLRETGLAVSLERDILPVQYGKLLINLQSPVNAISGAPVPTTLSRRRFRMAWRALVLEALDVFNACGIKPTRPYVPFLPFVLALPDWAYNAAAFALFPLDPGCKSSMLQDCETGRATEIDALCGEIVRLARRNANRARDEDAGAGGEGGDDARGIGRGIGRALAALGFGFGGFGFGFGFGRGSSRRGRTAPLNARAIELVRRLERVGLPDGRMGPDELWEALTR